VFLIRVVASSRGALVISTPDHFSAQLKSYLQANQVSKAPVAGAIAGVTAAAAYIDAKYHITKDLKSQRVLKAAARDLEKNCKSALVGPSACAF
jgi:hypothetical protein